MAAKLKDTDRGWKKHGRMIKRQAMKDPHVLVGVLGPEAVDAHTDAGLTVVELASYHEFGRGNNPERPFIRGSFDKFSKDYKRDMRLLADQVLTNKLTQEKALKLFGEKAVADMKGFMRDGIPPEKVDGKLARLKDTGQLYGSIIYQVEGL